jgi:hypothetical protein
MRQRQHEAIHCAQKRRKPPRIAALAIAATCALSACGPRDGAYDPSNFRVHAQIVPRDVAAPDLGDGPASFNGLYVEGSDVLSCCWIAPHATLLVRKRGAANTLVAGFRLPEVARFDRGQQVSISFTGVDAPPQRVNIQEGSQYAVKVPVPAGLRAKRGLIPVSITCTVEYVPSRDTPPLFSVSSFLHLRAPTASTDVRPLGVVLLYLYFQ